MSDVQFHEEGFLTQQIGEQLSIQFGKSFGSIEEAVYFKYHISSIVAELKREYTVSMTKPVDIIENFSSLTFMVTAHVYVDLRGKYWPDPGYDHKYPYVDPRSIFGTSGP